MKRGCAWRGYGMYGATVHTQYPRSIHSIPTLHNTYHPHALHTTVHAHVCTLHTTLYPLHTRPTLHTTVHAHVCTLHTTLYPLQLHTTLQVRMESGCVVYGAWAWCVWSVGIKRGHGCMESGVVCMERGYGERGCGVHSVGMVWRVWRVHAERTHGVYEAQVWYGA